MQGFFVTLNISIIFFLIPNSMVDFKSALVKFNVGKNFVNLTFLTVVFAFLGVALLSLPKTASAAMCIYANTDGFPVGDFNTAANWTNCNGNAPGVGDDVIIVSGTSTQLSAPVAISTINSSGTIDAQSFGLNVTSTAILDNGGVVTSTSGYLGFGGSVTVGNAGSNAIGSSSGNINVSSTFQIGGPSSKLEIGSGTTTLFGSLTIYAQATINGCTGTLEIQNNVNIHFATLNMQTAKTVFTGGSNQSLGYPVANPTSFSSVEVNKTAGAVTLSGNGTSTGNFTIYSGGFSLGSYTFRVGGNFIVSGGTFTPGAGTIELNGSSAQSVSSTAFTNLSIAKSGGTATLSNNATSTGNFSLTGGIFSLGSKELAVGGNFIVNGGVFSPGTATTTFNGSGSQSVSSTAFGALIVNKSGGTATLTTSVSTTGMFSVLGGTFDAQSYDFVAGAAATINNGGVVTSTSGNLGFSSTLTFGVTGANALGTMSGFINVSSSFAGNNGALDIGNATATFYGNFAIGSEIATLYGRTGTLELRQNIGLYGQLTAYMDTAKVILNGYGAHTWEQATTGTLHNIEINKSGGGGITISGFTNASTTGNLTLLGGSLLLGNNTLSVGGNFIVDGGTFTPQAGTIELNGSGAQSVSSTDFYNLTIAKSGNTATFAGNATTTNNFSITGGELSLGTNAFNVGGNFIVNGGTFTPGTATTTLNGSGAQSVSSTAFYDLVVNNSGGTATLTSNASTTRLFSVFGGTFDAQSYDFTAASTTVINNGGVVTSTSGNLGFGGTLTIGSTGSNALGSSSGNINASSTFTMTGASTKFEVGSGTSTFYGDFDISSSATLNGNNGTLEFGGGDVVIDVPTVNLQNSKSIFSGGIAQNIVGGATNNVVFGDVEIAKSANYVLLNNAATTTGNLTIISGELCPGIYTLNVGGNFTVNGGTFTPGTATTTLNGPGAQSVSSTGFYDLVINKSGSTVTFADGGVTVSGTLMLSNGGLNLGNGTTAFTAAGTPFQLWGGTFYPANGTVAYQEDQTVASTTYYNLSITPSAAKIATLNASTTALGAVTVNANGTLTVGANNFTVLGTIANTGQITVSTGSIIHPAESVLITNSSGVEVSSLSNTGSVYVTVQDSNRNLNGASVESFTVPVSFNAAAGSDAETMTLTETSVSSGIFRNASAVALVSSSAKSLGNNQFELLASGIGTATYTDSQDATDSASDIVTLTYVAPTVTPSVSGGGGGGGGGPTPSQTGPVTISVGPKTTIDTASLQKMQTSGFVIHQLVKLPDDGDPATQEDSAVYYLGADGRRHAFPNDKAYKTWYCDFSGVTVMPSADLAAIPLGRNVIYKSGRKMVKFTTDPKVYAVEKGGVLRWVTTEQLAIDFYGANWNKQIDDINDAFYTNYIFGQDIETAADFSPSTAVTKVSYPSDSMGIEGYTESAQAVTVFVCPGTTTPVDSDQDGLNDEQEITLGTDPTNKDTDGDSLTDGDEVNVYFTNPLNKDTDGDGYDDGLEVFTGHDPSADTDGDGLTDAEEAKLGTDPLKKDTDGDGYDDGTEVATGHDPLKE